MQRTSFRLLINQKRLRQYARQGALNTSKKYRYISTATGKNWPSLEDIRAQASPHWREIVADDVCERGRQYLQNGEFVEAAEMFNHAIGLLQAGTLPKELESSSSLSVALHYQGLVHHILGDYKKAASSLEQALAILSSAGAFGYGDDQLLDIGGLLNDLAVNYFRLGNHEKAEKSLKRCSYMAQRAYKPHTRLLALTDMNLAELDWMKNKPEESIEAQASALKVLTKVEDKNDFVDVCGNRIERLARLNMVKYCIKAGELRVAQTELEQLDSGSSEDIRQTSSPVADYLYWGKLYTSKGMVHSLNGEYENAMRCSKQALQCYIDLYQRTDHPDTVLALHNTAIFSDEQGEAVNKFKLAAGMLEGQNEQLAAVAKQNAEAVRRGNLKESKSLPQTEKIAFGQTIAVDLFHSYGGLLGFVIPERPSRYSFSCKKSPN